MTRVRYFCCDELRRTAVAGHPTLNAIEYLEVGDLDPTELDAGELARYNALPPNDRDQLLWQRRLTVVVVNPLTAEHVAGLTDDTVRIEGGERVTGIRAAVLAPPAAGTDSVVVRTSAAGDFSRYTLSLVRVGSDDRPPAGFDPVLSTVEFSFKIDCPTEFDCRPGHLCLSSPRAEPTIDYLAKDYASFRRLMLDRMALLAPQWRDRSPADLGVMLVELLAYTGDHLSYQQDAVATEAYLDTARRRVSVRRHATLVDYAMHEGSNARAWLHVVVSADTVVAADTLRLFTTLPGADPRVAPGSPAEQAALVADVAWFEPVVASLDPTAQVVDLEFFADLDRLELHTWGDERCCLPAGATRATLRGRHEDLTPGMVLLLEEVLGPLTGDPADADPGHRHVVRLTRVTVDDVDETTRPPTVTPLVDPLDGTPITAVEWHADDALPFALCVSSRTEEDDVALDDVSVARGNMVLVDHGRTVTDDLGPVPPTHLTLARDGDDPCERAPRPPVPVRFRPTLADQPLTHTGTVRTQTGTGATRTVERVRVDVDGPASAALRYAVGDARPAIALDSVHAGTPAAWRVVRDLLSSASEAREFVVETEHGGVTRLRFGDDRNGARPRTDEAFTATYRVGNGSAGNVGADAIVHAVTPDGRVTSVRNPLPASGGTEPETVQQVRRRAPQAFRTQERAVTPADYEEVTNRVPAVQRTAARFRWTGSWHTVFLTVDRADGAVLDPAFEAALTAHVDRYRMAGHDLEFDDPRFVSLEVELFVCVAADHFRSEVKKRLLDVLSDRDLPDGRRGLFHPDRFTFGQPVYLSPILAAARDVAGVASAEVRVFRRQGVPGSSALDDGRLDLGRLEIGRLANDPNFPEHGVLRIELGGGK